MTPKVSFLICGAQKAGTSSLSRYLRQHPQLFLPETKELHFFDNEYLNWTNPDYDILNYHFQTSIPGQLCGEATPITMYWDPAPTRVWSYNPAMKMIVVIRNPVSRAYSHWAMENQRSNELLSFTEALSQESSRATKKLPFQDRIHSYIDRGFYSGQIRRLWRLFGKRNVIVIRQDWLLKDPKSCLGDICNFLEIDTFPILTPHQERVGLYNTRIDEYTRNCLQRYFLGEIKQLEIMLEWDLSDWISV